MEGVLISAFGELRAQGYLGIECLALIFQFVREEAHRFPVLAPRSGWQDADLEDLCGEFLADRIQQVTVMLLAQAGDEASMGRLLRKSIRHWLIDQARKTAVGALRRRLENVLAAEDAFEQVPAGDAGGGRWRLRSTSVSPWAGSTEDLVDAARAVPNVKVPKWSSTTRRGPVADRKSIVAVVGAVLGTAGGSLEVAQLVAVFVARFPVVLDPAVGPLPHDVDASVGLDEEGLTPEQQLIAVDDEVDAAVTAAEVVGMLAPWERQIVPHLDNPPAIQTVLGCGRSQAYQHARRLKEKLTQLVGDSDGLRAVGLEVIRLCGATVAE
jgi:hypothetical protein